MASEAGDKAPNRLKLAHWKEPGARARFQNHNEEMKSGQADNLFDHLVGAGEQRCRHGKAECFCRFEIDHQFVLGRRVHRKVSRFLALKDAINVPGGAPVLVYEIGPVRAQAATHHKLAIGIYSWQFMLGRKRDNRVTVNDRPAFRSQSNHHLGRGKKLSSIVRSRRHRARRPALHPNRQMAPPTE